MGKRAPAYIRWTRIASATWKDAGEDNLSLVAAGVAFYAFLAFVPLLTALVLSYGLFADPRTVARDIGDLAEILPASAAAIAGDQLEAMTRTSDGKTGLALLVALGIAVYGASKAAEAIMTALNIVFEVGECRGFLGRLLTALGMTAGAVLLLLLAVVTVSVLGFLERLLPGLGGFTEVLLRLLFIAGAGAAVMLMLSLVYRYVPCRPRAAWRWITPGSVLATLAWLCLTAGFGLYVANFGNYNATYGSLGAVIAFLTWLYLTAYIILLGAELNAIIELDGAAQADKAPKPA
ncbi:MAG TPA: YihY/virulence factor BrkB family protein [Allosphingosinicella sp.]|nr:YihY/virulence factor BrkB family protein [Allosphingosinicella sp.]